MLNREQVSFYIKTNIKLLLLYYVEINKYLIELRNSGPVCDALMFWQERRKVYPLLAPLAEDLVSAPASQAFVEWIFSVCGILTTGRRNRMEKSLEMRVFLKLNAHIIN